MQVEGTPLKVMVSSTIVDLPQHREQVKDACLDQEMVPLMMEHQPASCLDPVAFSIDLVNRADVYVGVYAHRYGYVPDGHQVSLTEIEYNRACERGIPRAIFIVHKDHPIRREDVETGTAEAQLRAFKERVGKENFIKFFKSPEELTGQVISALSRLRPSEGLQTLHQLPSPPADFTGREAELAELQAAIEHGGVHISGLHGQGGVGKTALALMLAQKIWPYYPDAQIFLDLKGVARQDEMAGERPLRPAEAMAYVIRAFHPEAKLPEAGKDLKAMYLSVLHGKRALLLMDNARDAVQVAPLVPPQSCALLVTSRLHFTLPGLHEKRLDVLPAAKAEALLLEICSRIDGQAGAIAELCGYLPLALRLAAAALKEKENLAPADYIQQLEQHRLAALPAAGTDPSMEASIRLSYGLLSPQMQQRWRTIGAFPDTFDARAAALVWQMDAFAAGGLSTASEETLDHLIQYSMLDWNETTRRYRLHDLMRDFARARMSADELDGAARRHAMYYLNVLAQANNLYIKGGGFIKQGLALLDLEWGSVQAGQAWAAAHAEQDKEAARLCSRYPDAGCNCLHLYKHPRERIHWLEAALGEQNSAIKRSGHRRSPSG